MLELSLAQIADTLPDDDVARWFIVPVGLGEEAAAWGHAMAEHLAPQFANPDDPGSVSHLVDVFASAASRPYEEPFDQRLLYLPFGASEGMVLDVVTIPVAPQADRESIHRQLLGLTANADAEPLVDTDDQPIGLATFHVTAGDPIRDAGSSRSALIPNIARFWCVHRSQIAGVPADVVATGVSVDLELASLAFLAYGELILDPELYDA